GCKSDCPTNVDMATYKAEFLSHYYEGRLRPRHAYAFGQVNPFLRLASKIPRLANFMAQVPGFKQMAHWAAGMSADREIPKLALSTLHESFMKNHATGSKVILWADTFTNYLNPTTGLKAADVLQKFDLDVSLSPRGLCCGRPLYDYGFLDQ